MALQMTGEVEIAAEIDQVWAALNDKDVLGQCIPGCREIDWISDGVLSAVVVVKLGPVRATFTGTVTISEREAPVRYRISGEGNGGIAGAAQGGALVHLSATDNGTLLRYEVEARIAGKIAQLGQRLIEGTAKKNADEFFTKFAALMQQPALDRVSAGEIQHVANH